MSDCSVSTQRVKGVQTENLENYTEKIGKDYITYFHSSRLLQ